SRYRSRWRRRSGPLAPGMHRPRAAPERPRVRALARPPSRPQPCRTAPLGRARRRGENGRWAPRARAPRCARKPRPPPPTSGVTTADSPARLLLVGGLLLRGRLGPGGALGGPTLERALDVGEDAVTFLRSDQAATDRVADQLFGVVDGELAQSRGPAARIDQRVRPRAAPHTRH